MRLNTDETVSNANLASPLITRTRTILVVDDEETLRNLLDYNLEREGYNVLTASNAEDAIRLAFSERPDMVILDVMLPDMSGLEVCRVIRKQLAVPILILSAREEEIDKVLGLELGADDYMTKPFGLRELLARVHAMLRRSEIVQAASSPAQTEGLIDVEAQTIHKLITGQLVIDLVGRTVTRLDTPIELKPKEFDLLAFLASHPMHVFSRDVLLDRVWGYDFVGGTRTVDVHVRWLRLKIEEDPANPEMIHTVFGIGYKFNQPVSVKKA